ncbi:DUF4288 domain-containing protein [Marinobacter sp. CA1]|uniref:DUF4288 domain-containing protein n=1 Tax=Marinobacter sp. CA1 TaxID=2817656 RepID=UPI001D0870EB|nr:DUF4288 domain-containing protein [Marinobacter sp. CA1]UDL05993.1 DUF4288 domain-containing protein [Marinobacter sp. CA1]
MQIVRAEWMWYIAEFVIAIDLDGDIAHEYQIQTYLLKADSPEQAYEKAIELQGRLGDSIRNEFGEVVNYNCLARISHGG